MDTQLSSLCLHPVSSSYFDPSEWPPLSAPPPLVKPPLTSLTLPRTRHPLHARETLGLISPRPFLHHLAQAQACARVLSVVSGPCDWWEQASQQRSVRSEVCGGSRCQVLVFAACHAFVRAVRVPPPRVIAIHTVLPCRDEIGSRGLVGQFASLGLRLFPVEFPEAATQVLG